MKASVCLEFSGINTSLRFIAADRGKRTAFAIVPRLCDSINRRVHTYLFFQIL